MSVELELRSGDGRHTPVNEWPGRWRRTRAFLVVGSLLVAVAACGGGDDAPATDGAEVGSVAIDDTPDTDAPTTIVPGLVSRSDAARLAGEGITVIDVRTPEEYADGHLADATLIDFYDDDFADQIAALPTDQEYLVYCRSGNRSGQAVAMMNALGFDEVYDMDGGVIAYTAEGLPLAP